MKRQNKKAFTLVELLVVIAILAILATVAVVGYTSFIKNAAISNDNSVVAQMNRYLEALQADSTTPYFNKDVKAGNVRELTMYILKESGLNELEPESAKYGYEFYFDLDAQKYALKAPKKGGTGFNDLVSAAGEYDTVLENSFTNGNDCLVSTAGSELAELINDFYTLGQNPTSAELKALIARADELGINALANFIKNAVVRTDNADHRLTDGVPTGVIFVDGIKKLTTTTLDKEGNPITVDDNYVVADVDTLTVPNSVIAIEKDALNLGDGATVVINKTAKEVADMFGEGPITDAKLVLNGGEATSTEEGIVQGSNVFVGTYENSFTYLDFGTLVYDGKNVYSEGTKTLYISPEFTEFYVNVAYLDQSGNPLDNSKPVLGTSQIVWTVVEGTGLEVVKVDDTKILIKKVGELSESIVIKADDTEFTIKIQKLISGSVTLDGQVISENRDVTLVLTGDTQKFDVLEYSYNIQNALDNERVFTDTITLSATGDSGFSVEGNKFVVKSNNAGNQRGTLTINVGSYLTFTVNVTVFDARNFALQPKNNNNFTVLGNQNKVNLSDLFEVKGQFPEGATLDVFTGAFETGSYMNPDLTHLQESGAGLSVDDNQQTITSDNFASVSLQFSGTDANKISIAVMHNGVRISEDIEVLIVNAWNIRDYSDITSVTITSTTEGTQSGHKGESTDEISNIITNEGGFKITTITTKETKHEGSWEIFNDTRKTVTYIVVKETKVRENGNYVLLGDIAMKGTVNIKDGKTTISQDGTLTISKGETLYGNGFEFNLVDYGQRTLSGIINLQGTLRDVMIVGAVYPTFAFQVDDNYGSSAVYATGNAKIENCYIANTRSPLRVGGSNVTLKNSVLFGGRYANVDFTGGTLTIEGNVTTVQQVYQEVIGIGVSAWFNDNQKNLVVSEGANFIQYNFMSQSLAASDKTLPKLTITVPLVGWQVPVMDLKDPFNEIFNNTAKYGEYIYTSEDGIPYVNSGIASLDTSMLNFAVTSSDGQTIVTVNNSKTPVKDGDTLTVIYDSTKFTPVDGMGTIESNVGGVGRLIVTGAQLKAGVKFNGTHSSSSYMFQVQGKAYKNINVTGGGYSSLDYTYNTDLISTMSSIDSYISFHSSGIHYGKLLVEVNTPDEDTIAVNGITYQQLLEQYIEMGDYYTPEKYEFNSGSIINYWAE